MTTIQNKKLIKILFLVAGLITTIFTIVVMLNATNYGLTLASFAATVFIVLGKKYSLNTCPAVSTTSGNPGIT